MPLNEKTVTGIGHNYSLIAARVTLKAITDELLRRGNNSGLEKASGYFYFFGAGAGSMDRLPAGNAPSR
jgi:hypothetical protein